MPCYDERDSAGWQYRHEWKPAFDKLTRMLCSTLRTLSDSQIRGLPKEVRDWWADHLVADQEREARENAARLREQKRTEALKKLTPEERKLLNLK